MSHEHPNERDLHRGYPLVSPRYGLPVATYRVICGTFETEVVTDLCEREVCCELLREAQLSGRVNELGSVIVVSRGDFDDDDTVFLSTRQIAFEEGFFDLCMEVPE